MQSGFTASEIVKQYNLLFSDSCQEMSGVFLGAASGQAEVLAVGRVPRRMETG